MHNARVYAVSMHRCVYSLATGDIYMMTYLPSVDVLPIGDVPGGIKCIFCKFPPNESTL